LRPSGGINQQEGDFVAELFGTFNGLNPKLEVSGEIKRGARRQFAYGGEDLVEMKAYAF
jgi:hypothetical protein